MSLSALFLRRFHRPAIYARAVAQQDAAAVDSASVTSINNHLVFVGVDRAGRIWFCETSRPDLEWVPLPPHPDDSGSAPPALLRPASTSEPVP